LAFLDLSLNNVDVFLQVNHHFQLNNSAYTDMEHPRWGAILSVISMTQIKAGSEIFTFYGYNKGPFPHDHPWYFEALDKLKKEEKRKRGKRKGKNQE
jgi:hypothetical protein